MIIQIFRVLIRANLRAEFKTKFAEISVAYVQKRPGFISVTIAKSTPWQPDKYLMISTWKNVAAIAAFAGQPWNQAVIPLGIEKFVL